MQKGGDHQPIHRSRSVPELFKEGSLSVRSGFRVIPTTPRRAEGTVTITTNTSLEDDTGKFPLSLSCSGQEKDCKFILIIIFDCSSTNINK